jgi:hypothetical protein
MTDLAPIIIVTAGRMQCNVAYWLGLTVRGTSAPRPVYPQERTRGRARAAPQRDLRPGESQVPPEARSGSSES